MFLRFSNAFLRFSKVVLRFSKVLSDFLCVVGILGQLLQARGLSSQVNPFLGGGGLGARSPAGELEPGTGGADPKWGDKEIPQKIAGPEK